MKNRTKNIKIQWPIILFLIASIVFCRYSLSLLQAWGDSDNEPPWTTTVTIHNNTDTSYCRAWFQINDAHNPLLSYAFTQDKLGFFGRLDPGKTLTIEGEFFRYGFYDFWVQKCGTTLWQRVDAIVVSGRVCGPETTIQVGEPTVHSAAQTLMVYAYTAALTPLVTR